MKNCLGLLFAVLCLASSAAPHIEETLTLENGWNAVYIESTPDQTACEDFFRELPVIGAACYRSDADASTAQYDASGEEIVQKPVVYLQWIRGETTVSTLQSISGGYTYLLFATNAATCSFKGVPAVPRMIWRKVSSTETNEFLNLAGVSFAPDLAGTAAANYFGEGPYGTSSQGQVIYGVRGTDPNCPELSKMSSFGKTLPVVGGKAYAMTATKAGEWPGVIGIDGHAEVAFGKGAYASVKIRNRGTKARTFGIMVTSAAAGDPEQMPALSRRLPRTDALSGPAFTNVTVDSAWEVTLEPDAVSEQVFTLDRSQLDPAQAYGCILVIEDRGGSLMRVRLPVTVEQESAEAVRYPTGLWAGEIRMSQVSQLNDETPTPVAAGGLLKLRVLLHVDETKGACKLLQRVVAGIDTNGTPRLFRELSGVPSDVANPKRLSTVMMSVDTPVVGQESGGVFGKDLAFDWTVDAKARDNPFRHAWHPDHDGKKADYSGDLPTGDDFSLYANPVKPELWSISNRLTFAWHDLNDSAKSTYSYTADETTAGYVTWEVSGLLANKPVKSVGTFALQRVFKAKKIEE